MTIFDQIKTIAFTKGHVDVMQTDQPVSPYMLQRWLSMYSPQMARLINATSNQHWDPLASDPQMFVNLLEVAVPKLQFKRISYIKKPINEKSEDTDAPTVEAVANLLFISQREARQYIEQDPSISLAFADALQMFRKTRLNPTDDTN